MEEEDEIDVLGDFNLETLLTKTDEQISSCYDGDHQLGLHCDSPWILDTTTQPCWFESRSDPQSSFGGFSGINSPENYDNNSWSDKEKYLLEKGLELFGRSWSRLAQYIGSKSSSQVKSYIKTTGIACTDGKSSMSASSIAVDNVDFNFSELIDDMEIPASMEEVIAAVSTAQPTVVMPSCQREISIPTNSSLSRKTKCRQKRSGNFKQNQTTLPKKKEFTQIYNADDIKDVLIVNKEQDTIILPNGEQVIRMRHGSSLSEDSDVNIDTDSDVDNCKTEPTIKNIFPVEEGIQTSKEDKLQLPVEITIGNKEEFVHIKDETTTEIPESNNHQTFDLFVDVVEEEVSVFSGGFIEQNNEVVQNSDEKETHVFKGSLVTPSGKVMTVIVDDMPSTYSVDSNIDSKPVHTVAKYMTSIQERLDAVYQLPLPTQEIFIEPHFVTQEEKLLHPEFFSKANLGVNRYLKIRNYIIDCWKNSKPNYVTKTSVHIGLKSCGDVNLISRIHTYLEQKGYINFGCEQCQYSKPSTSSHLNQNGAAMSKDQVEVNVKSTIQQAASAQVEKRESCRVRKKKLPFDEIYEKNNKVPNIKVPNKQTVKNMKSENFEDTRIPSSLKPQKKHSTYSKSDGGYTLLHTESGEVILQHTNVAPVNKVITRGIKPIKLIHCKNYSATNKAPYRVEMEISALVLVDIHGHLSPTCEVIGLLGGTFRSSDNVLRITTAVPCQTILSSSVHCDMCPVSQSESIELITSKGLSVVGWYHSHPNFDPSPSDTDVDTQNTFQSWFNETGKPFVGLIISPYYSTHNVSTYRCCQVKMENSRPTPYQLEMKVTNYTDNLLSLKQSIEAAYKTLQTNEPMKHLNMYKCLESIKHHLKKTSPRVEEGKISKVLQDIRAFCKVTSLKPPLVV